MSHTPRHPLAAHPCLLPTCAPTLLPWPLQGCPRSFCSSATAPRWSPGHQHLCPAQPSATHGAPHHSQTLLVLAQLKVTGRWERGSERITNMGRLPYTHQPTPITPPTSHFLTMYERGAGRTCSSPEPEHEQSLNSHSCSTRGVTPAGTSSHPLPWRSEFQPPPMSQPLSHTAKSSREIKLHEGLFKRILFEWFLQRLLQYESLCLIEISSCLVKHTEVTQKYISELTELKKSKDYMQPEQNTCLYFLPIFKLG